jgi:hypothetical protein
VKDLPLSIADDPDSFADRVSDCIVSGPLSSQAAAACREHLKIHFDWEKNLSLLDQIMERFV